jgi:hypothetical protein
MYYLAYGSNLHPIRLKERVPSARLVGITELSGYELAFHKRGRDGSGKCNLVKASGEHRSAFGAVYVLDRREKPRLDQAEGNGKGYLDYPFDAVIEGTEYRCFAYRAQPTHIAHHSLPYRWYRELVLLGARFLGFPDTYVRSIATVESMPDPDTHRCEQNEALLRRIRETIA